MMSRNMYGEEVALHLFRSKLWLVDIVDWHIVLFNENPKFTPAVRHLHLNSSLWENFIQQARDQPPCTVNLLTHELAWKGVVIVPTLFTAASVARMPEISFIMYKNIHDGKVYGC